MNEAVPLNAAEKRNAFGGEAVKVIRNVAAMDLFTKKVKFSNKRYQHLEVSSRILLTENSLTENSLTENNKIIDTKKVYLDKFASANSGSEQEMTVLFERVVNVVKQMEEVFSDSDEILRSQGNMVLYYLIFRQSLLLNEVDKISRRKLLNFRIELTKNRQDA
ncbi:MULTISPECIES: hypothetical protein [unclassified Pseudoalteromonas]|uniref:hypothetical protein n=1 Tax=unclassified Pseudoalteromonas TaxID=194690 RepID=UPI0038653A7B